MSLFQAKLLMSDIIPPQQNLEASGVKSKCPKKVSVHLEPLNDWTIRSGLYKLGCGAWRDLLTSFFFTHPLIFREVPPIPGEFNREPTIILASAQTSFPGISRLV
jgi:hypothetical protein